jgi:YD repeat-containing protein
VVTATRRTDGLCTGSASACLASGNEIQREYVYEDGYFDGPSREFRGFGVVEESYIHSTSAVQLSHRTVTFHQEDHLRGQIESEEVYAQLGHLARRESYIWDTQADPGGARTQVFLREKKSEVFDIDGSTQPAQCRVDRNEEPDAFGRVATRCSLACGSSTTDCTAGTGTAGMVITTSAWANPTYTAGSHPAVRERPASVSVSYVKPDLSTATLTQQSFDYFWPQGNVHHATTTGDGTTNGNAVVTTLYDTYGNVISVTDPRGAVSTSVYSGTPFHLFPSSETNAVGHTVQTQWDLRYGNEKQVTGPNGEITVAVYDAAGRVVCEAKPGQSCSGGSPVPGRSTATTSAIRKDRTSRKSSRTSR